MTGLVRAPAVAAHGGQVVVRGAPDEEQHPVVVAKPELSSGFGHGQWRVRHVGVETERDDSDLAVVNPILAAEPLRSHVVVNERFVTDDQVAVLFRAADALVQWTLDHTAIEGVLSVNPVVGETNDGYLNAITTSRVAGLTTMSGGAPCRPAA